jgi:hypothetical protein
MHTIIHFRRNFITARPARIILTALLCTLLVAALVLSASHAAAATTTVTVDPANPNGWAFLQETPSGSGSFVSGPTTPLLGDGSARLSVDATGGEMLGLQAYGETPFSQITKLEYSTYQNPTNSNQIVAIALQLNVDSDLTDGDTSWQGRLVFEPYYTYGTPTLGSWQTWDALAGKWWASKAPFNTMCSQAAPCTWTQVKTYWPNGGIHTSFPGVLLKAGGGWSGGFDGNVDALTIGVSGNDTTYDFEAALGPCNVSVDVPNMTITLLADCVTNHTLLVPDGWTLDGYGKTLTAVDPAGNHFLGAVVKNGGSTADVQNLTVTTSGLANVCDGAEPLDNRLRGILFDGASGRITNNTVIGINQGASGCQEGNAIEVRNAPFDKTGTDLDVIISSNLVTNYQKNGITANGSVAATITNNTVTGAGPIDYIAQNGIQVGFGATAIVKGNTVSMNNYTPASYVACGLLLYQADGVRASKNTFFANERDQCNYGKGGGNFNPNL